MENTQLLLALSRIALLVAKDQKTDALAALVALMENVNTEEALHG